MKGSALMAAVAAMLLAGDTGASGERERRADPGWATTLAPIAFQLATNERTGEAPANAEDVDDADNTGRNVRDRDDHTVTPMDQGGSESDRGITARIRREIVANDALSTNAHNAKIITNDGVVTLRGPVKSAEEKDAIGAVAQRTPGVKRVDNQLEIEREQ